MPKINWSAFKQAALTTGLAVLLIIAICGVIWLVQEFIFKYVLDLLAVGAVLWMLHDEYKLLTAPKEVAQ